MKWLENTVKMCLLLIILRPESFVETGVRDLENELHYLIIFQCIYYYYAESKVENVFAIYFKTNIQNCFVLVYFVCHTPQFKLLVFAFQSENWIAQNFNFTVFYDFCLSLSWKYWFSQNVNHAKVQSKTNKYWKFHVDLTRRRLKSRLKKLGMVPKKLYRNTLRVNTNLTALFF